MSSLTPFGRIIFVIVLCFCTTVHVTATDTTIPVTNAAELRQALAQAEPGQTITLADGLYEGRFTATISGTALAPITVQGSSAAILQGEETRSGYVFHIDHADYWVLTGFTLRNALKALVLDNADNNVLDHLLIEQTGQEGVHFRTCSSHNLLQYSTIRATGVYTPDYGEGVYVGSDSGKWSDYSCDAELRDKSHYNQIRNNHFGPGISAEAIDVKEGTVGGVIMNNTFDATGLQGKNSADSWIDLKGNRYKVGHNRGSQGDTDELKHGFETHFKAGNWGRNNIFYSNVFEFVSSGYGIHIDTDDANHGNIVCANNQVIGAGIGVTNLPVTGVQRNPDQVLAMNSRIGLSQTFAFTTIQTVWLPLINTDPCG